MACCGVVVSVVGDGSAPGAVRINAKNSWSMAQQWPNDPDPERGARGVVVAFPLLRGIPAQFQAADACTD